MCVLVRVHHRDQCDMVVPKDGIIRFKEGYLIIEKC